MKRPRDRRSYAIVEDSPAVLVLEKTNRSLIFVAAIALLIAFPGPTGLKPLFVIEDPRAKWLFVACIGLLGLVGALDKRRIVFEWASRRVAFTSRLWPWGSFTRPTSDIERVELSSRAKTVYGQDDGYDYSLHAVFRDKSKLELAQTADEGYVNALAARIQANRGLG